MDQEHAQRIRDGLDRATGAFFFTLGAVWAIVLIALTLIGFSAVVAFVAERM